MISIPIMVRRKTRFIEIEKVELKRYISLGKGE